MIVQTLNGFAILDIIFGLLADYMHKFGKSTKAKANGHAPANGAGKRGVHFNIKTPHSLMEKRLAIDRMC